MATVLPLTAAGEVRMQCEVGEVLCAGASVKAAFDKDRNTTFTVQICILGCTAV
jgi:hypothetical protein